MTSNNGANLGFEQKMWQAADKLRGNMDAAEYKHVVLGVIFLKYISDASEEDKIKETFYRGAWMTLFLIGNNHEPGFLEKEAGSIKDFHEKMKEREEREVEMEDEEVDEEEENGEDE